MLNRRNRGLGYFSIALGVAELAARGAICRATSVKGRSPGSGPARPRILPISRMSRPAFSRTTRARAEAQLRSTPRGRDAGRLGLRQRAEFRERQPREDAGIASSLGKRERPPPSKLVKATLALAIKWGAWTEDLLRRQSGFSAFAVRANIHCGEIQSEFKRGSARQTPPHKR
jgi:hypothetical protein